MQWMLLSIRWPPPPTAIVAAAAVPTLLAVQ
jgi:hypothetical protein